MRTGLAAMTSGFSYEKYRDRLNAQSVLDYYGAENAFEQTKDDGTTEVIHSCLIDRVEPHHANGDANPSARCNLDKKTYVCYSYVDPVTGKSGFDLFELIRRLERKKTLDDIVDVLPQFLDGAIREADPFADEIRNRLFPAASSSSKTKIYSARMLQPWAFVHPYVVERGIDVDTASRLQIGYDRVDNRITIPHFWNGVLVGWQKRAIPDRPGQWPGTDPPLPKYRSSPGFPKSTTLYGGDRATLSSSGRLVVVESPFSVIRAAALGLTINDPVVATFGAKVTDEQIRWIGGFRDVVVWMDDDNAGRGAEARLAEQLYRRTHVRIVEPDEGMDLGDYDTAESVMAKIEAAVPVVIKLSEYRRTRWATNPPQ